jgi:hypothetical protein
MRDAEKFRNGVLNYCTAMNGSGEKTYFNAESPIAALAWERPRLRPWNDFYKVMALVDPNDMYELRVYGEYFRLYFTEDDIRTYRKAEFD